MDEGRGFCAAISGAPGKIEEGLEMNGEIFIHRALAKATDAAAVTRLLQPVPTSSDIRLRVGTKFTEVIYDRETRRNYWIGGDDTHVLCITISGLSRDLANRLVEAFNAPGERSLSPGYIADLISKMSDAKINILN